MLILAVGVASPDLTAKEQLLTASAKQFGFEARAQELNNQYVSKDIRESAMVADVIARALTGQLITFKWSF